MSDSNSVKLDKMGEAQQMLVMLSIIKEIMKPLEKPVPTPVPRPDTLNTLRRDWFETDMCGWFHYGGYDEKTIGPVSSQQMELIRQQINSFETQLAHTLDNQCWYVELPNQPVVLQRVTSGVASLWEIQSWPNDQEQYSRLGWLPVGAMKDVFVAVSTFLNQTRNSMYMTQYVEYNNTEESRQYCRSNIKSLKVKSTCCGIIIDNWLYLTDVVEELRNC